MLSNDPADAPEDGLAPEDQEALDEADDINRALMFEAEGELYEELDGPPTGYVPGYIPGGATRAESDDIGGLFGSLEVEGPRPKVEAPRFGKDECEAALSHYFGFSGFREGQKEAIEAVLEGRDVLAIMPTSAGKSLLYQLPAMLLPGTTMVISPLISLMKDQVDKLQQRGLPADLINSSLSDAERREAIERARRGETKMLFVAPERFRSRGFRRMVQGLNVSLFAVDEAHCISSWGHDFRPDYLKLSGAVELCGRPPVLAVTATATDAVRQDIKAQIGLKPDAKELIAGFDRPNLRFDVTQVATNEEKSSVIANLVKRVEGAGIIYCSTRKNTEKVSSALASLGVSAGVYHAGLDPDTRRAVQEDFMSGQLRIVCATNAFGMGIDKDNVRFVAHHDLPGSIEAYYQEAGRAGRDGLDSECLLLFRPGDIYIQEFFIDTSYPSRSLIELVYQELSKLDDGRHEITLNELSRRVPEAKSDRTVGAALRLLDEADHIDRGGRLDNPARIRKLREPLKGSRAGAQKLYGKLIKAFGARLDDGINLPLPELAFEAEVNVDELRKHLPELRTGGFIEYHAPFAGRALTVSFPRVGVEALAVDYERVEEQRKRDRDRLQKVIDFAYSPICRRAYILNYFGAPAKERCGSCDICAPRGGQEAARPLNDSELVVLKKLLSCVVRMKGRFGRGKVIHVLRGSRAKDIRDYRLDELSTHGLLADWDHGSLSRLMTECMKRRLVEEERDDQGRYPKVRITETGLDVLFDRARVSLAMPGARTSKRRQSSSYQALQERRSSSPEGEELFQALRGLRAELSRKHKIKPFMVFPDRTLRGIAEARPQTSAQLAEVKGVGQAKLRKYGRIITEFIADYVGR